MFDMKQLEKFLTLTEAKPKAMQGFQDYSDATFVDGAIPKKYKDLMAVAATLVIQCGY